jgi:hypothetical protein
MKLPFVQLSKKFVLKCIRFMFCPQTKFRTHETRLIAGLQFIQSLYSTVRVCTKIIYESE